MRGGEMRGGEGKRGEKRTHWFTRVPANQLLFEGIACTKSFSSPLSAIRTKSSFKEIIRSLQEVFFILSLGHY